MSVGVLEQLATEIATKLKEIQDAEREKIVLQNKLDMLSDEETALRDKINKLDGLIASTRYEISHSMLDPMNLSLVKKD